MMRSFAALSLLFLDVLLVQAVDPVSKLPAAVTRTVDFVADVQPILQSACWKCHNADKQRAGLRLDTRTGILAGGNTGLAVVVGDSAKSQLIAVVAGLQPDMKMPPDGPALTASQIGILRAWIDQGLKMPDLAKEAGELSRKSDHWAFQPIRRPPVPKLPGNDEQTLHPIDAFIRTRLIQEGLPPSPEAEKTTLLRRVYLDLIGLPPEPSEIDDFLADSSPHAYEAVVERLLNSPHYGERWARHWLDAARYADSDGYEKDSGRPYAWRFRDWVIEALNADKPFDRFTIEQIAGDLLPNAGDAEKIATGFHRQTLTNKEGGVDQEEFRVAAVVDRVNTTATVWLGLTVACAQCHDHKYDPISQREYYQLFAFFNSDRETDISAPLPEEKQQLPQQLAVWQAAHKKLEDALAQAKADKHPDAEIQAKEKALADHGKTMPTATKAMTLALGPTRPTHVMIRGDFLRPGVAVQPGTPVVLPGAKETANGTRLDLARWLVSAENPLTPRVIVNWVWQKYFGRGLVATLNDFGTQGEKPSHPELLDWLAAEFRDPTKLNWSLKRLHRLIVTSATYRQSSAVRPDLLQRDPLNILLARQSRLRLEAELLRDSALAVSGLLYREVGGPSVRPPQPPGISELTYAGAAKWVESTAPKKYKRGLYIWFQRTSPYPMLMTFDSPDANVCVVRRERSNTPLQALTLLNDAVFVEAAQALAARILLARQGDSPPHQIDYAVKLCLGRSPTPEERTRLLTLLKELRSLAADNPSEANKLVGATPVKGISAETQAAWVALSRTLLNLDEFVTRD
jgi:hypothetical protein